MSYTTQKLINKAFYKSGIVGENFTTATSSQIASGLDLLNDLLAEQTVDCGMIPFYTNTTFPAVIGQEKYQIENLTEADTLTFTLNTVRYAMMYCERDKYFGSYRALNVRSLPSIWHFERSEDIGNIYVYMLPSEDMTFEVWGKFSLTEVTQFQDLSLVYSRFYISYMSYKLAQRICDEFGFDVPAGLMRSINEIEAKFKKQMSPMDLTCKKMSSLSGAGVLNFGIVNLGTGGFLPDYGGF